MTLFMSPCVWAIRARCIPWLSTIEKISVFWTMCLYFLFPLRLKKKRQTRPLVWALLCSPSSMTPSEHLLPYLLIYYSLPYYFVLLPSILHTHTNNPCQSVNVIPGHPVTGVMTMATNYTPTTIPMALISWLAAMQCDQPSAPLLFCVDAFKWSLCACSACVHCWFLSFIFPVTPKALDMLD